MRRTGWCITFFFCLWSIVLSSPGIYALAKSNGTPLLYQAVALLAAVGSGMLVGLWVSEIFRRSYRDQLTGVYNRRYLDCVIKKEIPRATRGKGLLSVAIIDLDYFKKINDRYGHEEGDRILAEFAKLLVSNTRRTDAIIRLGGDEFLVIFPGVSSSEAKKYAERIQSCIAGSEALSQLSICVGIATTTGKKEFGTMFREADKALYKAKMLRNSVVCTMVQ